MLDVAVQESEKTRQARRVCEDVAGSQVIQRRIVRSRSGCKNNVVCNRIWASGKDNGRVGARELARSVTACWAEERVRPALGPSAD